MSHDRPVNTQRKPDLHPGTQALPSERDNRSRRAEPRYLPTLFDRLLDDAPSEKSESPDAYTPGRAQMRSILQRDLAHLLNSTNQSDLIDSNLYPAAAASTINFGVPPLAGGYLSEKRWIDIEIMIREAIRRFEPRLIPHTLVVKPMDKNQNAGRYNVLSFEISGLVQMQPYPMEFTVQSTVDLETNRIDLQPNGA
jgi:type VI secretion system protein ImpF